MKDSARERWERLPLEWNRLRMSGTPRAVQLNWAAMTEWVRNAVRAEARTRGAGTLVDVGCGNGGFADGLDGAFRLYVGIDPSDVMIQERHEGEGKAYLIGVGEALPLADESADVVILKSVLMHCFEPERVLAESARVLRRGGLLLVSVSNRRAWYRLFRRWRLRLRGTAEPHLFHFDDRILRESVEAAGLTVEKSRICGYFVLPGFLDHLIPERWTVALAQLADAMGERLFSRLGGTVLLSARRLARDRGEASADKAISPRDD